MASFNCSKGTSPQAIYLRRFSVEEKQRGRYFEVKEENFLLFQ